MPPPPPRRPRPAETPARRTLRTMLVLTFGLHVVAIAIHQLAHVDAWPARWRTAFLVVWMALTVAIVGPALHRIRQARTAGRRAPRP